MASSRCTQKYAVGSPASSKASPLPSFHRFLTKVIQMTPAPHPEGEQEPGDGTAELHEFSIAAALRPGRSGWAVPAVRLAGPAVRIPLHIICLYVSDRACSEKDRVDGHLRRPAVPFCSPPPRRRTRARRTADRTAPEAAPPAMSTVGGAAARPGRHPGRISAPAPPCCRRTSPDGPGSSRTPRRGEVLASHNAHWRLPPASHAEDAVRGHACCPSFPKTEKHKVPHADLAGIGEGSSLVGVKEDHDVHGPRPVARRLPALRQRRGARAVRDERRRPQDRQGHAGARRGAAGPRHARGVARTATTPRARSPARTTSRCSPAPDCRRRTSASTARRPRPKFPGEQEGRQEARVLRDPEHQPAAHR